ncbi:MAG: hypothetical protein F6J98_03815, partial [Moorea sp. SIO4G2]|nr:hypothetical protein [Moorena sp. SIO4G2]
LAGWDHKQAPLTSNQQPNNLPEGKAKGEQPWPKGHATRTTLAKRPRYANKLSTLAKRPRYANKLSTLAKRPRYANKLSTFNQNKP